MMAKNINKSTKRLGRHETRIIRSLAQYFQMYGREVIPHARLNIAWGSILSDVDLLLLENDMLTFVEVKSSRDKLSKAMRQIDRVKDYVDYAYVATDRLLNYWNMSRVGLISVRVDDVVVVKKPTRFRNRPQFASIVALQKKCLSRFLGNGYACRTYINQYDLARYVYTIRKDECTRECLKEIVTCGNTCDTICPISNYLNL